MTSKNNTDYNEVHAADTTDYIGLYLDKIKNGLDLIYEKQRDEFRECAQIIADQIANDKLLYVFGSGGHSNMMAEEMFHRAGGLACVSPIFVDSIRIPHIPLGERSFGIVPYVFDFYDLEEGDLLLLINGYGINPVTIETVIEAKKRGVKIIAITSTGYAERLPRDFHGRHPTGQNLHEMVEHVLYTYMPYGDAIVEMDGVESDVGSYSTFANAFICNSLVLEVSKLLVEKNIDPPIINSINVIDGFEKNKALYKKYRKRIRWL